MAEVKEKEIKPRDFKKVTIKANKFYKEDTEVEVHSELASKLLKSGKAYEGKPKEKKSDSDSVKKDAK